MDDEYECPYGCDMANGQHDEDCPELEEGEMLNDELDDEDDE